MWRMNALPPGPHIVGTNLDQPRKLLTNMITAILVASVTWFVVAASLFFNPIVDGVYRRQEGEPAVRALPKSPTTIGKILLAIVIQCVLWAVVYRWVAPALPDGTTSKVLTFGSIIVFMKMVPRDIDRMLLTTYPNGRMIIEFLIGCICAYVVSYAFVYFLS